MPNKAAVLKTEASFVTFSKRAVDILVELVDQSNQLQLFEYSFRVGTLY
jgi:hypothetical protein